MAGIIKNLIVRSLLYWIPMTSLPTLKTPSRKDNKPTKVSRSYHQDWTKSSSAPCEGQTNVLDCKRKVDLVIYLEGRTPILEGDNRFDLKPETLGQFLKLLDRKATDQGWNDASSTQQIGLFNVAQDDSFYSRITISITKEHYYIEMTALRAQYEQFMMGKDAQYQTHKNNQMLQECIWGSLTLRAQHCLAQ